MATKDKPNPAESKKASNHPSNNGSKLEPIMSKESVNLKNISIEKRLKNSETAPNELSPSLPDDKKSLAHVVPRVPPVDLKKSQAGSRHINRNSLKARETTLERTGTQ